MQPKKKREGVKSIWPHSESILLVSLNAHFKIEINREGSKKKKKKREACFQASEPFLYWSQVLLFNLNEKNLYK